MNTLAVENETASGTKPVEDMDHGELKIRLLELHRGGRLVPYPHGKVMGHAKRLKAGCPTAYDLSTVRRLIINARYDSSDDPVILIDLDDNPDDDEMALNYAEF